MDSRRVSTTSNAPSMGNIRTALTPRSAKDKAFPALKKALDLLKIKDLDGLEHHFLSMTAFLKPWCHFRDAFLLVQTGDKPRVPEAAKVRGADILWFYTNFSEGELRYDPRADDATSLFTPDETQYGNFDTTHWGMEEHEKMLYAWLLQEFKVGKRRNPFGFQYFELRNVCTAWRTVFLPIVEAVRDSYDTRGRRYYGRLANFIETRHPSRVAFPEGNVTVPQSANPYRMVSVPREGGIVIEAERLTRPTHSTLVTKKSNVVLEKELRDIYPKFGQVVEKPKANLSEFIANQKARIMRKNRDIQESTGALFGRSGKESPMFGCRGIDDPEIIDPLVDAKRRSTSSDKRYSLEGTPSSKSPSKRSRKEKGVVPVGMYGFAPTPTKNKSPSHGVTRSASPTKMGATEDVEQDMISHLRIEEESVQQVDDEEKLPKPAFVRPDAERKASDGVYSSIRNSNPFAEDPLGFMSTPDRKPSIEALSPMNGHPSAIPKPLFNVTKKHRVRQEDDHDPIPEISDPVTFSPPSKLSRVPSYAGTGYGREITPSFATNKLQYTLEHNAREPASRETSFALSETPEIMHPLERQDRLANTPGRTAPAEHPETMRILEGRNADIPQHVPWPMSPGLTPVPQSPFSPALTEWPRASRFEEADVPPPIPPRNPARTASTRTSASSHVPPPSMAKLLGPRIVSKENIRGHLSNISRDISEESLKHESQRRVTPQGIAKLVPFNKNMFPRRDRGEPLVGERMGGVEEDKN